jgi:hypothetical protein
VASGRCRSGKDRNATDHKRKQRQLRKTAVRTVQQEFMGKMCCATHHAKLFSFAPRRFADSTAALRTTPQCNDFVMNAAADAELMRCEDSGGATHSRAHDTHTRDSRRSIAAQHTHGQCSANPHWLPSAAKHCNATLAPPL